MHITMLALGSTGDVLPLALLGGRLRAAGHTVTLATFESFTPVATKYGLEMLPVSGDAEAILSSVSGMALVSSGQNIVRAYVHVMRSFGALASEYEAAFTQLVGKKTDLVINQLPGGLYGFDLSQALGVPMAIAAVMPLTRTSEFPAIGMPAALRHVPGYNRLSYRLLESALWLGFRNSINRWRTDSLGLPEIGLSGFASRLEAERVPVLNGFSQHVVPRPRDWGSHIAVTGYWFEEVTAWQPPRDLSAFIESGPPPIFIGFGSMPARDPDHLTRMLVEAVTQCGLRAVLQSGWAGLGGDLADNIFLLDYAPYEWLFPRMRAAVIHGGSGTTAQALRAGTPVVVVPFLFDQFYWGRRCHVLGVGPRPLPMRQLSASRLAAAINEAVTNQAVRRRAQRIGELIREEAGLATAANLIESMT